MAGTSKSGRRPRRDEERQLIGKHFTAAVSVIVELLNNSETPKHVRIDAARLIIEQHVGKPRQWQDLNISGEMTLKAIVEKAVNG